MPSIKNIYAFEFLDSRGNPTVAVEVELDSGEKAISIVPAGASKGKKEAVEIRDGNSRYFGKGVKKAISNVGKIFEVIKGKNPLEQKEIDGKMIDLDGTDNKSNLGANAILAVSLACAKVSALHIKKELFEYIGDISGNRDFSIPVPLCNVINGGEHAGWSVDFQEYMIVPVGFSTFEDAIRCASEIFHTIKKMLYEKGLSIGVGDEGGFVVPSESNEEPLKVLTYACEKAGYTVGKHVWFALDVASSSFYDEEKGKYILRREKKELSSDQMIELISHLCQKYPIISVEDPVAETDWDGWKKITSLLGDKIQLVGDDVFVTNPKIFTKGIENKIANSILVKVNQIGTLTETLEVINIAKKNSYNTIISHRSGDTEDTFIADLAVGVNAKQIKTGSLSRSERTSKYNRLLYIEKKYGIKYAGLSAFSRWIS